MDGRVEQVGLKTPFFPFFFIFPQLGASYNRQLYLRESPTLADGRCDGHLCHNHRCLCFPCGHPVWRKSKEAQGRDGNNASHRVRLGRTARALHGADAYCKLYIRHLHSPLPHLGANEKTARPLLFTNQQFDRGVIIDGEICRGDAHARTDLCHHVCTFGRVETHLQQISDPMFHLNSVLLHPVHRVAR